MLIVGDGALVDLANLTKSCSNPSSNAPPALDTTYPYDPHLDNDEATVVDSPFVIPETNYSLLD